MLLKVKSKRPFDTSGVAMSADQVKMKKHSMDDVDDGDEVKLYGTVTSEGVVDGQFELDDHTVMITDHTKIEHGGVDDIVMGVKLKVEGTMNSEGVLIAHEIEFDGHDEKSEYVKIAGRVQEVDTDNGYITIMGVNVYVNNMTWFEDHPHGECTMDCPQPGGGSMGGGSMGGAGSMGGTGSMGGSGNEGTANPMTSHENDPMPSFGLGDVTPGSFIKIKAYIDDQDNIVAVKVQRKMYDTLEPQKLKGPVTAVNDGGTIEVMGVIVDISNFPELTVHVGDRVEATGMFDSGSMMFVPRERPSVESEGGESSV
jgi:hypothetical protein